MKQTQTKPIQAIVKDCDASYTLSRAYQWARWIADENRSLKHRAILIRLIHVTAPTWFFNLVGIVAALIIEGRNQQANTNNN